MDVASGGRDYRQVIDGILHRVRTGVQWRELPERFGPWKTVDEHHRLWSADGTWEPLLQRKAEMPEHQGETPWQSLLARLVEVVREVSAWAARGAGSPANSN